MASKYIAHIVAEEADPAKGTASLVFHQETLADGTSETTEAAIWTYKNFVSAAVYNSTLNLTSAVFKLHVEEDDGLSVDVVLFDDSDMPEDGEPEPIKVV